MQFGRVEICGINTSQLKVISEKEKIELLHRAHNGDKKARDKLIEGNLRLVLSSIQRFINRGENPDDLFQVGCIGLIKAIDRFDTSLNVKFSTYAVPMILGELRRHLRDGGQFRVARSIKDVAYKAMQAKEKLQIKFQREPTIDEIAKELEISREDVIMALESIVEPVSIYEPVFSEGGDTIYVEDQLGDRNDDKNWVDSIMLKKCFEDLNDRERRILNSRFMLGKTQTEVADEIGISQAQVSRLEKTAMDRIKKSII